MRRYVRFVCLVVMVIVTSAARCAHAANGISFSPSSDTDVWLENFDGQSCKFLLPSGIRTEWKTVEAIGYQDFRHINESDVKSLSIVGPSDPLLRETSEAVSDPLLLPHDARMDFWLGCSLNYTGECSFEVALLIGSEKTMPLWSSLELDGSSDWQWRHVTVDLSDYSGSAARILLRYTYGTLDIIDMLGGFQGSFMVDDVRIMTAGNSDPGIVEAEAPKAAVSAPGGMIENTHRMPLMPLNQPLRFSYDGLGRSLDYRWTATDAAILSEVDSDEFTVMFAYAGQHDVTVTASNDKGQDTASLSVWADWHGTVCNMMAGELLTSHGAGTDCFPSNELVGATAYAERFVPPACVSISAVHIPVLKAEDLPQYGALTVTIADDADGLPGEPLARSTLSFNDIQSYTVSAVLANNVARFSSPVITDRPFHVVVSSLPAAPARLTLAASDLRKDGCGGMMLRGAQWMQAPADLAFMPDVSFSGIYRTDDALNPTLTVGADAGSAYVSLFSSLPCTVMSDASWCTPASDQLRSGDTQLRLDYAALGSTSPRTAHVTLSDGIGHYIITLQQSPELTVPQTVADVTLLLVHADGRIIKRIKYPEDIDPCHDADLPPGIYILTSTDCNQISPRKIIIR